MEEPRFRFRPARPQIAIAAGVMGAGLVAGALAGAPVENRLFWAGLGLVVVVLALLYLFSPAWRNEVVVDGEGLEVQNRGERRFRLAWSEVKRVVAGPRAGATAYVDGGEPQRSLLLPGRGARAPYRIAHQRELYDRIRAAVDPARIVEVDRLDHMKSGPHGAEP